MPNSLSVYTTNTNTNRHKQRIINRSKIKNKTNTSCNDTLKIVTPIVLEVESDIILIPEYESNCLICLDPTQETNKLFRMKDVLLINSPCECNGNFHMKCLVDWISVSKTCPICRNALTINLDILRQVETFNHYSVTVKLSNFIRRFVNLFYEIVMMMTKYIALIFLLNALLRVARDVYAQISDKR